MTLNIRLYAKATTLFFALAVPALNVSATEIVEPFADDTLADWQEKSFLGNTQYELQTEQGLNVLRASAVGTASVLYKEKIVDITETPWLFWQWKIDAPYQNINERTRGGDDFPARLYVTAQIGFLPWESVAINYVWSSNQALDSVWTSPYTEKSIMIAIQTGDEKAGRWVSQQRNVADDFKQFFNLDIKKISALAVMVDGDNAGKSGTAFFGKIAFSSDKNQVN